MPNTDINSRAAGLGRTRPRRPRTFAPIGVLASLVFLSSLPALGDARREPKRVLLLDSWGRDFAPYSQVSSTIRTELSRSWGSPIEFLQVTLQPHGLEPIADDAIVAYVRALCARRPPDLVVTNAAPALLFFRKYEQVLFPGVPVVYGGADERFLKGIALSPEETAVTVRIDLPALVEGILRVLPETKELFAVFGDSPLERFWSEQFRRDCEPFRSRVRLTFLAGTSFDETLKRAAALPPRSAIFFGLMLTDAAGIPHEHESALEHLRAVTNAPIFGWSSASLGRGVVGGSLLSVEKAGREIARTAGRVLRGEPPASIPVTVVPLGRPVYDARELERWGIDEKSLPPGSEVRFRPPPFFEEYRGRILAAAAVLVLQAAAIAALLEGRRRQRRAELEAARLRSDLAHAGRLTLLGQLASSIAHELAQPLGAILRNAEAAELFLASGSPDLAEIRAILADIKADDRRAGDVIERMRSLLRRHAPNRVPIEPAALVEGVLGLVRPDARARGVSLETTFAGDLPVVSGDPVHLQQVLLNLLVNAMEAMEASPARARVLGVDVRTPDGLSVEIAVRDSGPGISPEARSRLFEPFQTTKREGMGMGLAISRTLVEAHGGRLRAEDGEGGGATFVVSLPAGGAPA